MEVLPRESIEVSVVLYPEGEFWIAQGIEYDITARGKTPVDASEKFNLKVGAELVMSLELRDDEPLSGVRPAPQKFWAMFQEAKMSADTQAMPLRVIDGGAAPSVRPRIRIYDKAA